VSEAATRRRRPGWAGRAPDAALPQGGGALCGPVA